MMPEIFIPFVAIGLAELLDKSQLSLLLLGTRTKKPLLLLIGAMFGFLIVDGLAVLAGSWITGIVPEGVLKMITSVLFILFGILALRNLSEKAEAKSTPRHPIITGFLTIVLVEWGDKTQLATALFATQYTPFFVLIGVLLALLLLSAAAIFLGKMLSGSLDKRKVNLTSGIAFILIGVYFLFF